MQRPHDSPGSREVARSCDTTGYKNVPQHMHILYIKLVEAKQLDFEHPGCCTCQALSYVLVQALAILFGLDLCTGENVTLHGC